MILHKQQILSHARIYLSIVAILVVVGLIFIYSASSVYAIEKFASATYFVRKQLIGLVLGIIALCVVRYIPLRTLENYSGFAFLLSLAITALTLIPSLSSRIHGSSRWLSLAGFSFQPSELLKITLIMYIAHFLCKKEKQTPSFIKGFLPLIVILGITSAILLKQPDFGLTVTLIVTVCTMLFIAQHQTKYLFFSLIAGIPVVATLIMLKPYRLQRILTFLNPWADPQGSGFQIIQSLIAIGSGGFWGLGIGQSKQKFFYLPMQHTDFIFSIIAEETGFIGVLILIGLYVALLYFGLRIAWQLQNPFAILTILGFTIMMSLQALINIAVSTGLAPTKGTGLPFVSYGNTALICQLMMVGIILNLVHHDT